MRRLFVVISILLVGFLPGYAQANSRIRLGAEVKPLDAATAFCKQLPSRCESHPEAQVVMTAGRMTELVFINLLVNVNIQFQAEPLGIDIWQDRDFGSGDCEDFALLKRRQLIELGWPPGALRVVIVLRKKGDRELHAFLVASTDRGDFVLDSPDEEGTQPRPWNPDEFYELRMIWGADAKWYALDEPPALTVGAAK